jgi:glycosyltransferase involved in cell wall biosynthesis
MKPAMGARAKKITILHVVLGLGQGGTEKIVVDVANGLSREDFASSILCMDYQGRRVDEVREDVPIYLMGRRPGLCARNLKLFNKAIKGIRPDIVHFRNFTTYLWGCLVSRIQRNVRIVYSDHGNIAVDVRADDWGKLLARRLLKYVTDQYMTNSMNFQELLTRCLHVDPTAIVVIPNGIDTDKYFPMTLDRKRLMRTRWGYSNDEYVIGIVASLRPVKNVGLLIGAMHEIIEQIPHACLAVVGEGELEGELRTLVVALGLTDKVRFLGRMDEVNELLNVFDVFVLPSAYGEGMPNAVLEAMAAKVPVVASAIQGNVEVLDHGRRGVLFKSNHQASLVESLVRVARNRELCREIVQQGYEYITTTLTLPQMIQRYEAFYHQVYEGQRGRQHDQLRQIHSREVMHEAMR